VQGGTTTERNYVSLPCRLIFNAHGREYYDTTTMVTATANCCSVCEGIHRHMVPR